MISFFWDNFGKRKDLWSSDSTIYVISSKTSGWFWWVETTGGLWKGWGYLHNKVHDWLDIYELLEYVKSTVPESALSS